MTVFQLSGISNLMFSVMKATLDTTMKCLHFSATGHERWLVTSWNDGKQILHISIATPGVFNVKRGGANSRMKSDMGMRRTFHIVNVQTGEDTDYLASICVPV